MIVLMIPQRITNYYEPPLMQVVSEEKNMRKHFVKWH